MPWPVYLVLALPPSLLGAYLLLATARGLARLPRLGEVRADLVEWPSVSIVSPACNEERTVAAAMASLLATDYPALDVIAVDDRSSDATGALLDGLARTDGRLAVLHLDTLPSGWLGKVHALARGTERARGEWLLFMDADVHLAPGALRRAVAYAVREELDLMSVVPTIRPSGGAVDAAFGLSLAILSAGGRLQAMRDPGSPAVAATGAFILVRRAAFERTPGFAWLRLEVADDFGLALLLKSHGGRCAIVNGRDQVGLTWYGSVREMAVAMQKNLFAILGRFSIVRMAAIALLFLWFGLFPLLTAVPTSPPGLRAVPLVGCAAVMAAAALASRRSGRAGVASWLAPLGSLLFVAMVVRAAFVGWRVGGIEWRGVRYSGAELAPAQRVRV